MSKIAISRLEQDDRLSRKQGRGSRTQRACDNCRKRKVRCTGEPQCRNCVEQDATCIYTQSRRDRLNEAIEKNTSLITLLKDLSIHVDDSGKRMIEERLDSLGDDDDYTPASATDIKLEPSPASGKRPRDGSPSYRQDNREAGPREAHVSESVGEDGVDILDEDLLRSQESRATGYVGTNSSMQWMRSLKSQMASPGTSRNVSEGTHMPNINNEPTYRQVDGSYTEAPRPSMSDSTFYLDRNDLQLDGIVVDPYELPEPDVAQRLFDSYLTTVHASFPIVPHVFEEQFRKYNESVKRGRPYPLPEEWQAMLNLIMAIGAQYSHLLEAKWKNEEKDHLIYMTRATRLLRLDKLATSLPSPSLSFIQSTGLLALYYLTIGQVSRAWMMIGISLRFALAAGLHLRNDDPSAPEAKSQIMVRTWWSLHSIETLLCGIIGRPCIIPNDECTVPLPQVLPQQGTSPQSECSNSTNTSRRGDADAVTRSSFFGARVTIALIMQKALSKLYSPRISADSWDSVQRDITSLNAELNSWAGAAHMAGLSAVSALVDDVPRHNFLLAFHFQSTKLLICRPCLCRLQRRISQSDASNNFNAQTAEACVAAAQAITWLLPDEPDRTFFYEQTPWWCTVHIIMQAVAVLLLKMSYGPLHSTHKGEELSGSVRKLVRWLRRLSATSDVAERAYNVSVDIIKISAPRIQIDITTPTKEEPDSESGLQSVTTSASSFMHSPNSTSTTQSEAAYQSFPQTEWGRSYPTTRSTTTDTTPSTAFSSEPPRSHFSSPDQRQPTEMDNTRMENLNAFRAQQQAQGFGGFQFDPTFPLYARLPAPLVFGSPFVTNYDQPGFLFNNYHSGEQMHLDKMNLDNTFNLYMDPDQEM
ncbi:hypothetical protein CC80DRAFT_549461 [Byssothecium circinans]|uniref:Zn(2)-C6 fungal-type domain-containing protein n=1 Tax=Byssothecium circinans TaxID=147558 RepID=A0A6A5TSK4_9PLEO|nr:hypothetical protein CC80DRAFT_549461 [Byssothecium circinans]